MGRKDRTREDRLVLLSRGMEHPEDWLHFVHFPYFMARWVEIGFGDNDLRALEILIMCGPDRAPVVAGTGGLRKIRFARSDSNRGKSGGARIGYVFVPEFQTVGIVAVYAKNRQENLTAQQKNEIRLGISRFKEWLAAQQNEPSRRKE